MRSYIKAVFMVLGINSFLIGCTTLPYADLNRPYQGNVENQINDDQSLANKIQRLIDASYPKVAKVKVLCAHYNVLVVGEVASQSVKDNISTLVKSQAVVREYWDYTTIDGNPRLFEDIPLGKQSLARLSDELNVTQDHLQTIAVAGVVYVVGDIKIDDVPNLDHALAGIYSLTGVNKVVNLTHQIPYGDFGPSNNSNNNL